MPIISYYWMHENENDFTDYPFVLQALIILCLVVLAISFIYLIIFLIKISIGEIKETKEKHKNKQLWIISKEEYLYREVFMKIKEQVKDFIAFEDETSIIYPWAIKADNITDTQLNNASSKLCSYGYNENMDIAANDIYEALNTILGINPVLIS